MTDHVHTQVVLLIGHVHTCDSLLTSHIPVERLVSIEDWFLFLVGAEFCKLSLAL
jgi:hypothetical protein